MKHSIRQRVLDPVTGLMLTKIEAVTGELGSGIVDKNGREIFEGDIVRGTYEGAVGLNEYEFTVTYKDGALWAGECGCPVDDALADVNWAKNGDLEIIGHVEDVK